MEKNAIIAFVLSMAVFGAYFLFFSPKQPPVPPKDQVAKAIQEQKQFPSALSSPVTEAPAPPPLQSTVSEQAGRDVVVKTRYFEAVFSEAGAALKSFKLTAYKEKLGGKEPKELIQTDQPAFFPLQLEWIKNAQPGITQAKFIADKDSLDLSPEQPKGTVTFRWTNKGLTIIKTYTMSNNSYRIDLDIQVINKTSQPLDDNLALFLENRFPHSSDNSKAFQGVLRFIDGKYKETSLGKVKDEEVITGKIRWGALADTYFMGAVVPLEELQTVSLKISKPAPEFLKMTFVGSPWTLAPKEEKRIRYALYFGPRDTKILQPLALDLEQAVNFGFFDVISKPLLWVLRFFNGFLHNYGWSIIILTILVKILFWPLTHKSYKSMKDMQKLQPKIAKLREKHKDNREKLNQETMALYKTYKVNPLGGCLPMVIQIPVFFALYSLLGYAIELRHAPFFLWINDLSAPDRLSIGMPIPYVGDGIPVLTLLMGASMFLQQKMTPTTGDPTQAKMMLFLPVIFTFMFINFAAGLVLYWFVNNVLSIGQQYYINKYVK
jgi:YidC/Oxa1 family membrane protein insertase